MSGSSSSVEQSPKIDVMAAGALVAGGVALLLGSIAWISTYDEQAMRAEQIEKHVYPAGGQKPLPEVVHGGHKAEGHGAGGHGEAPAGHDAAGHGAAPAGH